VKQKLWSGIHVLNLHPIPHQFQTIDSTELMHRERLVSFLLQLILFFLPLYGNEGEDEVRRLACRLQNEQVRHLVSFADCLGQRLTLWGRKISSSKVERNAVLEIKWKTEREQKEKNKTNNETQQVGLDAAVQVCGSRVEGRGESIRFLPGMQRRTG
jgi:hypothetical protein